MRILFDQGTPAPLRHSLVAHAVDTAYERGWSSLQNGELIAAAEAAGYEVLVTTDKNLKYQQQLDKRVLAIVVLGTTSWPRIQRVLPKVLEAIASATSSTYREVYID